MAGFKTIIIALVLVKNVVPCQQNPILVHALFRHGDRTPDLSAIYPNDPYKNETYFPYGHGQLTNRGKLREYKLGKFLRSRYNKLLGDLYTPEVLDARSTDVNRTKMSLELVLAGLFPPKGKERWIESLDWQPIPYNYWPVPLDKVLNGVQCPSYSKYYQKHLRSEEVRKKITQHQDTLRYLSENTGWNVTDFNLVFDLIFTLTTEEEWGWVLPEWTKRVYPEEIEKLVLEQYGIFTGTLELRQLISGYFLQKVVEDTKSKIDGNLVPATRKLFLYSGHELTIAALLYTLDIRVDGVPPYGSCVMIELHQIENVFGFKIFYQDYKSRSPILLKLPNCEEFCPLEKFVVSVDKYFPTDSFCENG